MAFTAFRDMKSFPQFMFSIFVVLVSFLFFMLASLVVAIPLFGLQSILNLSTIGDLSNPESMQILKFFQVVQAIGLFIIPPIILGWLFHGNISEYLHLKKSFSLASFLLVLLLMFFAAPFINLVGELNQNMLFPEWLSGVEEWMKDSEEKAEQLTKAFLKVDGLGGLMFNLFMIALLPALGEEFLFRGVIQRIFTKMTMNSHWGVWLSAILFSGLHMQFYGFVPRMLLGVLFGYLLVWSGSMWLPILAHLLNNGIAVIAMYMVDHNMLNPEMEEIGSSSGSYYMAVLSLGLIVVFMILFKRQNEGNQLQLNKAG